jgi:hypothetical protein
MCHVPHLCSVSVVGAVILAHGVWEGGGERPLLPRRPSESVGWAWGFDSLSPAFGSLSKRPLLHSDQSEPYIFKNKFLGFSGTQNTIPRSTSPQTSYLDIIL